MRVIFATGYDSEGVERLVRDTDAQVLCKPFSPADLLDRVAAALTAPAE